MPRAVLRQNVKALLDSKRGPTNPTALGKAAKVGQASVNRILDTEKDVRLSTIERIAKIYDLEPWQLLVAGMNPANPPVLAPLSPAERKLYESLRAAMKEAGERE